MPTPRASRWSTRSLFCLFWSLLVAGAAALAAEPPQIVAGPSPASIRAGRNVTLRVEAAGDALAYQWYLGASGDTSVPVAGGAQALLVTPPLFVQAEFWVRVSNEAGVVDSATAVVQVEPWRELAFWRTGAGQLVGAAQTTAPVRLPFPAAALSRNHGYSGNVFLLRADGTLAGFGQNLEGQLGDGTTTARRAPVPVPGAADVREAVTGYEHGLFLTADGTLWATGRDYADLDVHVYRKSPVAVATGVVHVATGAYHSLHLTADGTLWALGQNHEGQLGDGTLLPRTTPFAVAGGVAWAAAGSDSSFFVKRDGTLWAMGSNESRRFGATTPISTSTPLLIAADVQCVAAGEGHLMVLHTDGSLWMAGANSGGQLGDGSTTIPATFVHVADDVVALAPGVSTSHYLTRDGSLFGTGGNWTGQLGDGTTTDRTSPVLIATEVADVAVAEECTFFLQPPPPDIVMQPSDAVVLAGAAATLTAGVTGEEPLTFQWYAGSTGDVSQPVPGATSASWQTPALTADATYWLRVTNRFGSADTEAVTVTVATPPAIAAPPAGSPAPDFGASPFLRVEASGGALFYQWYRGPVGDMGDPVARGTGALLVLPPFTSGEFWVRVSNLAGTADSAAATVTTPAPACYRLRAAGLNINGQLGDGTLTSRATPVPVTDDALLAATGENCSFFVRRDHTLWGMGSNAAGPLGERVFTRTATPVFIASDVVQLAAGTGFGCHLIYLRSDGTVWSVGSNQAGELADGTKVSRPLPQQVFAGAAAVAAGTSHTLILGQDGTVWAFGSNTYGQLGSSRFTPPPVPLATGAVAIAAGGYRSFVLEPDGTLRACGAALGDAFTSHEGPPRVVATGIAAVAAGQSHTLILRTDGSLWGAGSGTYGEAGAGEPVDGLRFIAASVRTMSAQGYSSWFITDDGDLWAVGRNNHGQLGDGTTTDRVSPVLIAPRVSGVAAGSSHVLFTEAGPPVVVAQTSPVGVLPGGTAALAVDVASLSPVTFEWFAGESGDTSQPVTGAEAAQWTTPPLSADTRYWVRLTNATGASASATLFVVVCTPPVITQPPAAAASLPGRNATLTVSATGGALRYQWYRGASGDVSQPVAGATGARLVATGAAGPAAYWVRVSNLAGTADSPAASLVPLAGLPLRATGSNAYGQLGPGATTPQLTPHLLAAAAVQAAAGASFVYYLLPDGDLWAVGRNHRGQLGDGTTTDRSDPVLVAHQVRQVSAGWDAACFLTTDGTLWTTGDNSFGQCGDGTKVHRSTPFAAATDVVQVSTSGLHTLFVKTDGSLWGMGWNSYTQLGDGTSTDRFQPVPITSGVRAVSAGLRHTLFVRTDDTLWGMGDTGMNRLATLHPSSGPLRLLATGVRDAEAGAYCSLFIRLDGSLWAMGNSAQGTLGPAFPGYFITPTKLADDVAFVRTVRASQTIIGGSLHTIYVTADGTAWASGMNVAGQLGTGDTTSRTGFTPVATGVVDAAVGDFASYLLQVPPPASAVVLSSATTLAAGTPVTLTLNADGYGPLSFQWRRGGEPLAGATGPTLTLPAAQLADSGDYDAVVSGPGGAVASNVVTLRVHDEAHLTYASWAAAAGAGGEDPLADPGPDGVPALLRYAFDLLPAGAVALPVVIAPAELEDGAHLAVTFTRKSHATDLTYVVEASADLATWEALATIAPGVPETVTVTDPVPLAGVPARYLRVRVELAP